jgi:glucose/arabinose dehydrogenase
MSRSLRFLVALACVAALLPGARAFGASSVDGIHVPAGFTIEKIGAVPRARELAAAPNGDLFVASSTNAVYLITDAERSPSVPKVFVRVNDAPAAGIALGGDRLYIGSQFGVWEVPYHTGDVSASSVPRKVAKVRPDGISRDHVTTSVAVAKGELYAGVGASCDACQPELDPTRATIQRVNPKGGALTPVATHIRNAIALTENPATGTLWAGAAGQDALEHGHPYEIFDAVTLHGGVPDYGWPYCYDDHKAVGNHDCRDQTVERVAFPAYDTPIGAVFYPLHPSGPYAFPAPYRGGAFVTLHGSWHQPPVPPRVAFVPLNGDEPKIAIDWNDPAAQWREFVGGFQNEDGSRIARPTGIAVGPDGSLFVSEDTNGTIYRIRPTR